MKIIYDAFITKNLGLQIIKIMNVTSTSILKQIENIIQKNYENISADIETHI